MKYLLSIVLLALIGFTTPKKTIPAYDWGSVSAEPDLSWADQVGAQRTPENTEWDAGKFGLRNDTSVFSTPAIQAAIDACHQQGGGTVVVAPGYYKIGALFIKSGVNLHLSKGTTLLASDNIQDYPEFPSRIAGIEMTWPSAVINIMDAENAALTGEGFIDCRGKVFWDKYWAMREEYEKKNLRWIVDYDCKRVRGVLVSNSKHITLKDFTLVRTGFWACQILYSDHCSVSGLTINNNVGGHGPSTDGIDIDSSEYILVQNANINCNDDNFCLKAGRDSDGLRVNRPCQYVVIRDCVAGSGGGMFTCGSETSGGIRNIVAYRMKGVGTKCGLRFKSTCQRGGVIEDIYLYDIEMIGVERPFVVDLNWNPAYSISKLPKGYDMEKIPVYWSKMLESVSLEQGTPVFRNVTLDNVTASNARTCMNVVGIANSKIENFILRNVCIEGNKAGKIIWAKDWKLDDVQIKAHDELILEYNENVDMP